MGYAEERLQLFARLRQQRAGRPLADALRLDGRALRFHLGTSLADVKVPVHVEPALGQALAVAARELFFLLCARHRTSLREHETDRLLLLEGFDPKAARPPSYTAPGAASSEGVRRGFFEVPELHPALDSGIFASWIGAGRPGRALLGALHALLRRAKEEGATREPAEPTPYLVLLALRPSVDAALDTLRTLPVTGPVARTLASAVASGLLVALRTASREAGLQLTVGALECEAALTAISWTGGTRGLWGSGAQPYGIAFTDQVARVDGFGQALLAGTPPETVAREAMAEVTGSREVLRRAARAVGLSLLRGDLLQLLRLAEVGKAPQLSVESHTLPALYSAPGALERVLAAPALRKDLATRARAAQKLAPSDAVRGLLENIAETAHRWTEEEGAGLPPETVAKRWAVCTTALAVDVALDRALRSAEGQLAQRTGAEVEGGIEAQHAAGRLYRLALPQASGEETPLLLQRAGAQQMGHLFCDMKDFTKRTVFLKEAVVADFLAREFYGPILTAAGSFVHGAAHLEDKGGLYLNNLLGDAVSFSGDLESLIVLAREVRQALMNYAKRLQAESGREAVARGIAQIEDRAAAERARIDEAMASAREAQRRGTLDPASGEEPSHRLRALEDERHKIEETREAEISLVKGEKLEAGIFISWGAAPEVAMFDDHLFGRIKVSIAEKINESARGTARNGGVRARVDALLAKARAKAGRPELACPFSVAVSQPLSISLPAEVEETVRRRAARGDVDAAASALQDTVKEFIARLASQPAEEGRGDIYNGGVALSEEALEAYVERRSRDLVFLRRDVEVDRLHAAVRDRLVFPSTRLRLVLGLSRRGDALEELYVFAGHALFRGFEKQGGLGVYEALYSDNPFFELLAQYHLAEWLQEHQQGLSPDTGSFPSLRLTGF